MTDVAARLADVAERMVDRPVVDDLPPVSTPAPPPPKPNPNLWAGNRVVNTMWLRVVTADGAPASAVLVAAAHAIAFAGRASHRTYLTGLADRTGLTRATVSSVTDLLFERRLLAQGRRREFRLGSAWQATISATHEDGVGWLAPGRCDLTLLALLAAQRDRATLARAALGWACLIGGRQRARVSAAQVAALTRASTRTTQTAMRRLTDLGLVDGDRYGPRWQPTFKDTN